MLGQYPWYRRREGGHWELWALPKDHGHAWLRVRACFYVRGRGPDPRLSGRPVRCEHYWVCDCSSVDEQDICELPEIIRCPVCRAPIKEHALCVNLPEYFLDRRPAHKICTGQLIRLRPVIKSS